MALLLMEFDRGVDGTLYQEVINGYITRWFDMQGNEVTLPINGDAGVAYHLKDDAPPKPEWYIEPFE